MATQGPPPPPSGPPPGYGYQQPPSGYQQQPPYGYQQPPYGAPQYPYGYGTPMNPSTNGLAIASLVMAFVFWPLGLIFGFIARSQISRTGEQGRGLALAGIIISSIGLVVTIVFIVAAVAVTSHVQSLQVGPVP